MTRDELMLLKPQPIRGPHGEGRQRIIKQVRDGNGVQRALSLYPDDLIMAEKSGLALSDLIRQSVDALADELGVCRDGRFDWLDIADHIANLEGLDRSKVVRWALAARFWLNT